MKELRDSRMTKLKMLKILLLVLGTAAASAFVLIVGLLQWLDKTYTVDRCFVRICPYFRAIVAGKPTVSTRLYMLGPYMRFLLVLTSNSSNRHEAYYIDVYKEAIGVPDFGRYRPFRKGALVSWLAIEGFADDATVVADWDWINNDEDLRIRVRGLSYSGAPAPLPSDSFGSRASEHRATANLPEMIQLAYGREIILVHSATNTWQEEQRGDDK
jgi:hypothetical protein